MAQIGAGDITRDGLNSWPYVLDTAQDWANGTPLAADSNTRIDAEYLNDVARTLVNLEKIIGANPQGAYASLVARIVALEARVAALEAL